MESISLGPLLLPLPRLFALASFAALLIGAHLFARHLSPRFASWGGATALAALLGGRLLHVALNWTAFGQEPLSALYLWQGGFSFPGAAAAAVAFTWWRFRADRRLRRLAFVPLGLAGLCWLLLSAVAQVLAPPGKPLPALVLQSVEGAPLDLATLAGRPVVVNLWATWCAPCRREMPLLRDAAAEHPEVAFVLADQGESPEQVRAFLAEADVPLGLVYLDPERRLGDYFDAPGYPITLFFDSRGRPVYRKLGELSRADLTEGLGRAR